MLARPASAGADGAVFAAHAAARAAWLDRRVPGRTAPDTRLTFQIQFKGFGNIGYGPTGTLLQNIRGWQLLNAQSGSPAASRTTTEAQRGAAACAALLNLDTAALSASS